MSYYQTTDWYKICIFKDRFDSLFTPKCTITNTKSKTNLKIKYKYARHKRQALQAYNGLKMFQSIFFQDGNYLSSLDVECVLKFM